MSGGLICSRCGRSSPAQRVFCEACGLGLQVLAPAAGTAAGDAPVGGLYLAGLVGGVAGLLVSSLLLAVLLRLLRDSEDAVLAAGLLSVLLSAGVPLLFGVGAAAGVVLRAYRLGLRARRARALLGSVWPVGLGLVVATAAGEAFVVLGCLFAPLGAARLGLGLFGPWWPLRRLLAVSALLVAATLLVHRTGQADAEGILLDHSGGRILVVRAGTARLLDGSKPAAPLGLVPESVVGAALLPSGPLVGLASGSLLPLPAPSGQAAAGAADAEAHWYRLVRLGRRLLILDREGLLELEPPWSEPRLLWPAARGVGMSIALGALGRSAHVLLEDGDLLELTQEGSVTRIEAGVPPLAQDATLTRARELAYAVVGGRRLLRRRLGQAGWEAAMDGLRVSRIVGVCALGEGVAVATDRGLFLGEGSAQAPFRRVLAGRFDALQATETGALAVAGERLVQLDPLGGWTERGLDDGT